MAENDSLQDGVGLLQVADELLSALEAPFQASMGLQTVDGLVQGSDCLQAGSGLPQAAEACQAAKRLFEAAGRSAQAALGAEKVGWDAGSENVKERDRCLDWEWQVQVVSVLVQTVP